MHEQELLRGLSEVDESYITEASRNGKGQGRKPLVRWISLAAVFCLIVGMALYRGNGVTPVHAMDLMEGVRANSVEKVDLSGGIPAVCDFSLRLAQQSNLSGENVLISPLSLLYALSMTANGAQGETLTQMETVMGMDTADLNRWLYSFNQELTGEQLKIANSIWFKDDSRFHVNPDFLQTNADYYGAGLYQAAFDQDTLEDINNWVKEKTNGMIPQLLNEIGPDDVMFLINALCFDGVWETPYEEYQVDKDFFTREDGEKLEVDFMYSTENLYLKDSNAAGFVKPYEGGEYAFVALLPDEGVTVEEYLESLTGERLAALLSSAERVPVITSLPKFEMECSVQMNDILMDMGMELAFNPAYADLSSLGTHDCGNLYISQVLQKTYISVDERGTKAAAATEVTISVESALVPERMETVKLDRPFVYMIVHWETGIPLFIGTMMDPAA